MGLFVAAAAAARAVKAMDIKLCFADILEADSVSLFLFDNITEQ